ncbi:hypothetical protein [Xanthomonas albilineans]|uniref:hypothetical protein n=1 Tax=Xanthomonas albilineans TaxID=29447 RepID=UPI0012D4BF77|nr:hypothetical protein [Xanthomonas albilineans]
MFGFDDAQNGKPVASKLVIRIVANGSPVCLVISGPMGSSKAWLPTAQNAYVAHMRYPTDVLLSVDWNATTMAKAGWRESLAHGLICWLPPESL